MSYVLHPTSICLYNVGCKVKQYLIQLILLYWFYLDEINRFEIILIERIITIKLLLAKIPKIMVGIYPDDFFDFL